MSEKKQETHEFVIGIAGDDGKFYGLTDKDLRRFEITDSSKHEVVVGEMKKLCRRGVAYSGIDNKEGFEDGSGLGCPVSKIARNLYFVNLAHKVPVKRYD